MEEIQNDVFESLIVMNDRIELVENMRTMSFDKYKLVR